MSDRSETARVLSDAWDGFKTSMAEASPDAQRRLVGGTFGALAILTVLAGGVAFWLSGVVGDGPMPGDPWFFEKVKGIMSVELAAWVDVFGSSAILIPIVLTVAILTARAGTAGKAFAIVLTFLASKIMVKAAWVVWNRPRPGGVVEVLTPDKPSFPSGHVVQAVVIYGLLAAWWAGSSSRAWEKTVAWTLAALFIVGTVLTRIRLGAHYASDCWAAVILGGLWLGAVLWAEKGFPGREA